MGKADTGKAPWRAVLGVRWARLLVFSLLFGLLMGGCKHADSSRNAEASAVVTTPSMGDETAPPVAAPASVTPVQAAITAIPSHVELLDLDETEVAMVGKILTDQFDPCGKSRSFLESVQARDCAIADRLARFVVRRVQKGYGQRRVIGLLLREIERLNTVVEVAFAGAPRIGPPDGKVKVVTFSDFQCPHCRKTFKPLKRLRDHYGFTLYYKHYPLRLAHKFAEGAARAAWAAQQQGKFWPMHDTLFSHGDELQWASVKGYAKSIGLDIKRFIKDVQSKLAKQAVESDYQDGVDAGVDGTPTFFVNGRRAETLAQLQDAVREQMGLAGIDKVPARMEVQAFDPPESASEPNKAAAGSQP